MDDSVKEAAAEAMNKAASIPAESVSKEFDDDVSLFWVADLAAV